MMPTAGGDFDYLRRAFGDRVAFSFAWYNFFVGKSGSQAIIATIFGRYLAAVLQMDASFITNQHGSGGGSDSGGGGGRAESPLAKAAAIALILASTAVNCAGVKQSAVVSTLLTSIKVGLVVAVFVLALLFASSSPENGRV
eukprot:gene41904-56746_t